MIVEVFFTKETIQFVLAMNFNESAKFCVTQIVCMFSKRFRFNAFHKTWPPFLRIKSWKLVENICFQMT